MSLSYKDALVQGKPAPNPVKQTPKKIYKSFTTGEIKKMCIWGKLAELKQVNPAVFTKLAIELFVKTMTDKLNEIALWKYEDQNQYEDILNEFTERETGIKKCIDYVNSFINQEQNQIENNLLTQTNKPNDLYNICINGKYTELVNYNSSKISKSVGENLIIKLKEKVLEIEVAKSEELNQNESKQFALITLANNILQCINWLGALNQNSSNDIEV